MDALKIRKEESGFSVVEALVSLGLLGIIGAFVLNTFSVSAKINRQNQLLDSLNRIRTHIASNMSCLETYDQFAGGTIGIGTRPRIRATRNTLVSTAPGVPMGSSVYTLIDPSSPSGGRPYETSGSYTWTVFGFKGPRGFFFKAVRLRPGVVVSGSITTAKAMAADKFYSDDERMIPFDFNHPLSNLYPGGEDGYLCPTRMPNPKRVSLYNAVATVPTHPVVLGARPYVNAYGVEAFSVLSEVLPFAPARASCGAASTAHTNSTFRCECTRIDLLADKIRIHGQWSHGSHLVNPRIGLPCNIPFEVSGH